MASTAEKLSIKEKVGYSLGDLSANLVFQTLISYLSFFYTDIYKIPADKAGTISLVAGILGACFNLVMGAIADRTVTRWGKFRPWILWTAVPFGLISVLAFTTPDFGENGKVAYAFITYLLLMIIYSANNLPYAALSGVITGDMNERNSLSSYRFVAVMVAQFVTQALLLPIVTALGGADRPLGFQRAVIIFAVVCVICNLITFLTTKERIVPKPEQKSTVAEDLKDLGGNKPWLMILIATILVFVTLALKGGSYVYYFKNYLDLDSTKNFLNGFGLTSPTWQTEPAESALGLFNGLGIIFMIVGISFSKGLANKYGKRDVFITALIVSTLFILGLVFVPKQAVGMAILMNVLHGFFYGLTIPLLWAMIADVADYSEWKHNRRATAIIFSAMIFGLKVGLSIGGAFVGWLLAHYRYDALLPAQAAETIAGTKLMVSVYPTLFFVAAAAVLYFYEINKKMEVTIEQDLKKRRD